MAAHTDNSVEISAPLDFVWERMMDIESWPDLFSEYANAEVIERDGDRVVFRLTTHPDPDYDGKVWSWTSERIADPAGRRSSSRRIETGPFEYMNIEWSFEDLDGATRMRWVQDFSMKPEAPADDSQAEQYMNKNTKDQMQVIKERLEARSGAGSS
ncbi:MAG TPA: SRPBCC family protein [Solirubrobacteraceae bacterium]|jgi:aromatase|nr:SRPBCC family protein [Solirubrobacteraceae bacterium]